MTSLFEEITPKAGFQNNDIYVIHASDEEHHYKELKEKNNSRKPKNQNKRTCTYVTS